jgi:copper chaperone
VSIQTHAFQIEGMHCGSCAILIDETLEDLPGVVGTRTSMRQGRSVVELNPASCEPRDIVAAIGELGYAAQHMP